MDSVWRRSGIVWTGACEIQAQSGLPPQGIRMKAPKYQRVEAVEAAIQTAGHERTDPIEGLQITDKVIAAWAGGRASRIRAAGIGAQSMSRIARCRRPLRRHRDPDGVCDA